MKKGVFKIIAAVVALSAAASCAVSPVFAISVPDREQGVTASGAIVRGEKSALAVESEKLTFDIKDFPQYGESANYKSTVTAEYRLVNDTENTVTTSMAFPAGRMPSYFRGSVADTFTPKITVDGKAAEVETRYTYGTYENVGESVKLIGDEWYSDDFYSADLTVTEYSVNMDFSNYDYAYAVGEVTCDSAKARYLGRGLNYDGMRYYFEKTQQSVTPFANASGGLQHFYVLGDASEFTCDWHAEVYGRRGYVIVDLPVTVSQTREMTLKDLALELRDEDSVINDLDFYNGVVRQFEDYACALSVYYQSFEDSRFSAWYTYDLEVEPGGSVVNSVTSPVFPTQEYGYIPDVFMYRYLLPSADEWQSFGSLEIVIKTQFYVSDTSVSFSETEGGYVAELDELPNGRLAFSLCESPNPEYPGDKVAVTVLTVVLVVLVLVEIVVLAPIIFAIVYLVKSRKKR